MPWFPTLIATWPPPQIAHRTTRSAPAAGSIAERWLTRRSGFARVEPDGRGDRRTPRQEAVQERRRRRIYQQERGVLRPNEAFLDGVAEEREEPAPVAADVHEAHRLPVDPELGPGEDLEDLLQRAEAARQRHEAVRQRGHQRLPL